jgi:hypothetical protein
MTTRTDEEHDQYVRLSELVPILRAIVRYDSAADITAKIDCLGAGQESHAFRKEMADFEARVYESTRVDKGPSQEQANLTDPSE